MEKTDQILVTGARGLVGSNLVEMLRTRGYKKVYGAKRADADLTNLSETKSLLSALKPVHVIHCAGRVYGIGGNMENQGGSFFDNLRINSNVIEAARVSCVEKITVMGTGCIYGADVGTPLRESEIFSGRPHASEAGYAHAKRAALAMLEAYQDSYKLDWAYVVSCNLFGPGDTFNTETGHVVPMLVRKFYDAKKRSTPVMIWGDGSAERDFLYVKDACDAIITVAEKGTGAINIGSGYTHSIREVVEKLSEISGVTDIVWDSSKPNGQDHRSYDLRKLDALGFERKYTMRMGLQETWDWYSERQS